jgi:hypothetical protein
LAAVFVVYASFVPGLASLAEILRVSTAPRVVRGAVLLALVVGAAACGGHRHGGAPAERAPVEACVRYEQALGTCFHRSVSIAEHPTLLPGSDAERARTEALCTENLHRIQLACR